MSLAGALLDCGRSRATWRPAGAGRPRASLTVRERRQLAVEVALDVQCELVDELVPDSDLTLSDRLESSDHSQSVGFPEPNGPTRIMKSPSSTPRVHVLDGLDAIGVALGHVGESDFGHGCNSASGGGEGKPVRQCRDTENRS